MKLIDRRVFGAFVLMLGLSVLACAQPASSSGEYLLVLNKAGNDLTILNPADYKVLGTIKVGDGPHEIVVTDDGSTAYVTNYGGRGGAGNSLSVIDIKAMRETKRVDLGPLYRPHGIKILGANVYFSVEANNAIARYNPSSGTVDWIMGTGQLGSHMVVGTSDERVFYTPNIGSNTVTMISRGGSGVRPSITHIPVGVQPEAIDLSPDGKEVWVGLNADHAIDVIDTATKKVTNRIKLSERPYRVVFSPDGKTVYVTIFATREVVKIDVETKKIVDSITLKNRAFGITFTRDGKYAFVTTIQNDGFVKLDLENFKVVSKGTAGLGPDGIAVTF